MELSFATEREKAKFVSVRPLHDKFGIADAYLVAPGAPDRSVLLHRLARRGRGQMPPLATALIDPLGVRLLAAWIDELGRDK
jgi:hypothetical protein